MIFTVTTLHITLRLTFGDKNGDKDFAITMRISFSILISLESK